MRDRGRKCGRSSLKRDTPIIYIYIYIHIYNKKIKKSEMKM